jgi:hypothetical protein
MDCSKKGAIVKVVGEYCFNKGKREVTRRYPSLLKEIKAAIAGVDASVCKVKTSKEKTMPGQMLYSPVALNKRFKKLLYPLGWESVRVPCDYSHLYYLKGYKPPKSHKGAFREMDFVKQSLGVEVQFGKYAFMVYNVCAKMTIFHNLGYIKHGVEIVPTKAFANEMSSGVSYFEQFVWDLEKRGVSNIDIPVLILGIDA